MKVNESYIYVFLISYFISIVHFLNVTFFFNNSLEVWLEDVAYVHSNSSLRHGLPLFSVISVIYFSQEYDIKFIMLPYVENKTFTLQK